MYHRGYIRVGGKHRVKRGHIEKVTPDELRSLSGYLFDAVKNTELAVHKAVDYDDFFSGRKELNNSMRAYKAGAAGNKNRHNLYPLLC